MENAHGQSVDFYPEGCPEHVLRWNSYGWQDFLMHGRVSPGLFANLNQKHICDMIVS